jgi:phosphohistidine phosphatase
MRVTVIRHGTAEDRAATDAERALTPRGRDEVAAAADRLAALGGEAPDSIVASPLVRARQSAEIVARRLAFTGAVQIDDALVPDAEPAGVWELVAGLGARWHVVLVAHEPILSAVCALLTGTAVSTLRKAEVVSMATSPATPAGPAGAAGGSGGPGQFAIRFRV